jgi:hypothetical protein
MPFSRFGYPSETTVVALGAVFLELQRGEEEAYSEVCDRKIHKGWSFE